MKWNWTPRGISSDMPPFSVVMAASLVACIAASSSPLAAADRVRPVSRPDVQLQFESGAVMERQSSADPVASAVMRRRENLPMSKLSFPAANPLDVAVGQRSVPRSGVKLGFDIGAFTMRQGPADPLARAGSQPLGGQSKLSFTAASPAGAEQGRRPPVGRGERPPLERGAVAVSEPTPDLPARAATQGARKQPMHTAPFDDDLIQGPAQDPPGPPGFAVNGRSLANFMNDRDALTGSLDGSPGPVLDLAEFLLVHRMVPEARTTLSDIEGMNLKPSQATRRDAIAGAISILDGKTPKTEHLFSKEGPTWPDRDLWRMLAAARGDSEVPEPGAIDAALVRLDDYPQAFRRDVLLDLLEVAVMADHDGAKVALSQAAQDIEEISRVPRFALLAGKAARDTGREDDAILLWQEAAVGTDAAAQRARLLLADLGFEDGTQEALYSTIAMLEEGRTAWHGDDLELGLLTRLARAYEAVSDRPKAASVMADIIARFPGTPEADFARQRAMEVLSDLYAAARSGEVPLSEMILFHRRNVVDFRSLDGFANLVQSFARALGETGATAASAAEYQRARDLVAAGRNPAPDRMANLALDRIEMLLEGGQDAIAAGELADMTATGVSAIDDRRALMEVIVAHRIGKNSVDARVATSVHLPSHLLRQANVAKKSGDWSFALELYLQVSTQFEDEMVFEDAVSMLIAARRASDKNAAQLASEQIARTADNPAYAQIAEGILSKPVDVTPLRGVTARQRLAASDAALRKLAGINANPTDAIN